MIFVPTQGWDRHTIRVGCHLFIEKDGKLLLNKRKNTKYWDGYYALVGGHVDVGENPTQTAIREAYEELGIKILAKDLEMVNIVTKLEDGEESIVFAMRPKRWKGIPKNMEPEFSEEIRWFSFNSLPKNIIPYVKQVIKNIRSNVFYSEYGWK